jgi:long-chain acyl-CoA synthetase
VEKGDRVAILLPNSHEILESYYGIWKSGGLSVSLNPMYTEREIEYIVNNSGVKYLVTPDAFLPRIEAVRPNMPSLNGVKMVSHETIPDTIPTPTFPAARNVSEIKALLPTMRRRSYIPRAPQAIQGSCSSHNGLITTVSIIVDSGYYRQDDCALSALPFFHGFALLVFAMNFISCSDGLVIHERFDPEATLRDFGKYGVSVYFGVPTMYSFLLDTFDPLKHDVDKLRFGLTGAAPVRHML